MSDEKKTDRVTSAIARAAELHQGMQDIAGEPLILQTLFVMNAVRAERITNPRGREALLCAAALHDVLVFEDDARLAQEIYDRYGNECHAALIALLADENQSRAGYIERVCGNWIARRIKIAQLRWWLQSPRAALLDAETRESMATMLEELVEAHRRLELGGPRRTTEARANTCTTRADAMRCSASAGTKVRCTTWSSTGR